MTKRGNFRSLLYLTLYNILRMGREIHGDCFFAVSLSAGLFSEVVEMQKGMKKCSVCVSLCALLRSFGCVCAHPECVVVVKKVLFVRSIIFRQICRLN